MADKPASEVVRISIGRETREADIVRLLRAWRELAGKSPAAA
jgi:cysteine desulfurase